MHVFNIVCLLFLLASMSSKTFGDSAHWRGPAQTGAFAAGALPASWSPEGENLRWKAPYGSRSAPLVMDGRVYLINRAGEDERLQERVMALDLDTGALIWEHRFNVFLTDVVSLRVGWANLAGDPATGNIYAHGVQGLFFCFNRDGKVLWSRSLTEEFGRISGYGGRTNSPTVAGDLVLIDALNSGWGTQGKGLHRFLAMDKLTGEVRYWAEPSGTPLDTTYAVPVVETLDGKRTLFTGLADGTVISMDPVTGNRNWQFNLSKRGLNASVVYHDGKVYAAHSEENLDSLLMGRVVCLDARTGTEIWRADGVGCGYATPVLHAGLLYVPVNKASLVCLDADTGEPYWEFNYGKEAKGSPVYADGKIYVGEVGGTYHILKANKEGCEKLHSVTFRAESGAPIEIFATPLVEGNRVLLPTMRDTYCIGLPGPAVTRKKAMATAPQTESAMLSEGDTIKHLQLQPAEAWVGPKDELPLRLRAITDTGKTFFLDTRILPEPPVLKGIQGAVNASGVFTPAAMKAVQAGTITATFDNITTASRIRIIPDLPYTEDFESHAVGAPPPGWITSKLKTQVVEYEGGKVLKKLADRPEPAFARLRCYMMPPITTGYTVQADMLGASKKNRFIPDMGLINSRYLLILTGTTERTRKLRLVSWAPIPRIQREIDFPWNPDAWYSVKLSVQIEDGSGLVRGKVWPKGEPEPDAWTLEMTDPSPNTEGSPGLYAYSVAITSKTAGTEVLFDNVAVSRNE